MTHDPTRHAQTDEIVAELEKAGLVETYTNDEGKVAYRLTPKGIHVANQAAMSGEDDQDALPEGLLDQGEEGGMLTITTRPPGASERDPGPRCQ